MDRARLLSRCVLEAVEKECDRRVLAARLPVAAVGRGRRARIVDARDRSQELEIRRGLVGTSIFEELPEGCRVVRPAESPERVEEDEACLLYTSPSPRDPE